MNKYNFVPVNEHPEMFIGELPAQTQSDNNVNSVYSQDTKEWD